MNCPLHKSIQLEQSFADYFHCRAIRCGWWQRRAFPLVGLKRVRSGPEPQREQVFGWEARVH